MVEPYIYRSVSVIIRNFDDSDIQLLNRLIVKMSNEPSVGSLVSELILRIKPLPPDRITDQQNILLGLLPSLRSLSLQAPPPDLHLPEFLTLQKLEIDLRYLAGQRQVGILSPLLQIPSLRNLGVWLGDVCGVNPIHYPNPSKQRTSPVTCFRIHTDSKLETELLSNILGLFAALKCFIYQDHVYESYGNLAYGLALAVSQQRENLTQLSITGSDNCDFWNWSNPSFGSLAAYSYLRQLAIPEEYLWENERSTFHELLPSALEELQIQYLTTWNDGLGSSFAARLRSLSHLAKCKEQLLPKLRRVISWGAMDKLLVIPSNDKAREVAKLKDTFEKVGVKFELASTAHWSETPLGQEDILFPEGDLYKY